MGTFVGVSKIVIFVARPRPIAVSYLSPAEIAFMQQQQMAAQAAAYEDELERDLFLLLLANDD
jgi:hypothetical protein